MKNNYYLLIVLELIVQDDSIGLVRLGPGEGDAVHGAADLVHDGHCGRSCERKNDNNENSVLNDQSCRQLAASWMFSTEGLTPAPGAAALAVPVESPGRLLPPPYQPPSRQFICGCQAADKRPPSAINRFESHKTIMPQEPAADSYLIFFFLLEAA